MFKNNFEIIIKAPIAKVWQSLTDSDLTSEWMKNVKVVTDWKEGSSIVYTCYDKDGEVVKWQGKEMIWTGIIQSMSENKEFSCIYPNKSTGLEKESYFFESVDGNNTKVTLFQDYISQEAAVGYKDGSTEMLQLFKKFLEK